MYRIIMIYLTHFILQCVIWPYIEIFKTTVYMVTHLSHKVIIIRSKSCPNDHIDTLFLSMMAATLLE